MLMPICWINDVDAESVNQSELNLSQTKHFDKDCDKGHIHLRE